MAKSKTNKSTRRSKKRNQEKKKFTPEPEPKKVKHFKEETKTTATIATNQRNVTTQLKEQTPDTSQESSECKTVEKQPSSPSTVPTSLATNELEEKIENKDQPSNKECLLKNGREELKEKQVGNKCPHGIVKDDYCVECDIELEKEVDEKILSLPHINIEIEQARLDIFDKKIRAHPEDYDEICKEFLKDTYKNQEVLEDCINRLKAAEARKKKLFPDLETFKKM